MIYSNYPFTLDIHGVVSQISFPVSLNDTARSLLISLTDGGKPYEITDGCRAVLAALKPDGTCLFNDCIIVGNKVIRYDFTPQTASVKGKVDCEVRLYGVDGNLVTSPRFTIVVYEGLLDERILSVDEKTTVDNMVLAEQARIAAENERIASDAEREEIARRAEAAAKRVEESVNGDDVFIRYSAYPDGRDYTDTWQRGLNYIGVAAGLKEPEDASGYQWSLFAPNIYVGSGEMPDYADVQIIPKGEDDNTVRHAFTVNKETEGGYLVSTGGYWNEAGGYRYLNDGEYTVWRYPIENASKVTSALWHGHTAANTLLEVSLDGKNWVTVIDNGGNSIGWQKYRELTNHLDFANSDAEYLYVRIGVSKAEVVSDIKYTVRGAWYWNETISFSKDFSQVVNINTSSSGFSEVAYNAAEGCMKVRMTNGSFTDVYRVGGWLNSNYRTLSFASTDQEISKDFYDFILANAVSKGGVATKHGEAISLYSCILNDMPITLDIAYGEVNPYALPEVSDEDNGAWLRVVNGHWRKVGGENVVSRVQTYSFTVGESGELKYLSAVAEEQGYNQTSNGVFRRFADGSKRTIVYNYHLANSAQIRGLVWSAICGQQLKLEMSYDGETWQTVFEGGSDTTQGLSIERRSFDLMPLMGSRGLLCYDELHIRISDVEPSTGWGGLVQGAIYLRTERFELPFGF